MEASLIDQLEDVLTSKDVSRRADVLRKVTDLFVVGSGRFSEDQIELFDHVMGKLIENIERAACAQFGNRIATIPDAPPRVVRTLAFHDAIEIAGPVLQHSERLDQSTLVENAKTKGQDHLLAISGRKALTEAVTDILVERGNKAVVSKPPGTAARDFRCSGFRHSSRKLETMEIWLYAFGRGPIFRAKIS